MYFVLSVQVVVVDDLSNAVEESLNRVRELTKCDDDQLVFRKVRSPPPGGAAVFPLDLPCLVVSSSFADKAGVEHALPASK